MKRLLCVCSALIIVISMLSGCSESEETMYIKPVEFSEETAEVLSLFDNEISFYDFLVDETVNSVSYDIWVYEDDLWVNYGKVQGNVSKIENRLAVKITDNVFTLYLIDENGHSTYTSPNLNVDFSETSMQVFGWEKNPVDIEMNKEILIYSKYGTDESTFRTNDTDFRSVVCDKGIAITATFMSGNIQDNIEE